MEINAKARDNFWAQEEEEEKKRQLEEQSRKEADRKRREEELKQREVSWEFYTYINIILNYPLIFEHSWKAVVPEISRCLRG